MTVRLRTVRGRRPLRGQISGRGAARGHAWYAGCRRAVSTAPRQVRLWFGSLARQPNRGCLNGNGWSPPATHRRMRTKLEEASSAAYLTSRQ